MIVLGNERKTEIPHPKGMLIESLWVNEKPPSFISQRGSYDNASPVLNAPNIRRG
ncbi:MAG: hypothetical protein Q8909_08160 [Bacteroidota bacterium]|nr:hypothetical protein [Bacteroidota bacterium]